MQNNKYATNNKYMFFPPIMVVMQYMIALEYVMDHFLEQDLITLVMTAQVYVAVILL